MQDALDREFLANGPFHRLPDGRLLNEIDSEYFLRNTETGRMSYLAINYCPFCGKVISRGLWNAEKKK
jgi:hypothetical protein